MPVTTIDIEAERAVLGSILLDYDTMGEVAEILGPDGHEWFSDEFHAGLYRAMMEYHAEGRPVDMVTLIPSARYLDESFGVTRMSALTDDVPSSAMASWYADQVRELGRKRIMFRGTTEALQNPDNATSDEIAHALRAAADKGDRAPGRSVVRIDEGAREVLADIRQQLETGQRAGVPTGFDRLDDILGGWQESDLIIVASRPSVGKSALAINFAQTAAIVKDKHVLFFSLEMSRAACIERVIACVGKINMAAVRNHGFEAANGLEKAEYAAEKFGKAELYIADAPNQEVGQLRADITAHVKVFGVPDLIIVDYMQLMHVGGNHRKNRQEEISEISRRLKSMAREFDVPIIVLSQLTREAGKAERPELHHLRESGSIEQDADVVLLLHPNRTDGMSVHVGVAKHRNGQTGGLDLKFNKAVQRFEG